MAWKRLGYSKPTLGTDPESRSGQVYSPSQGAPFHLHLHVVTMQLVLLQGLLVLFHCSVTISFDFALFFQRNLFKNIIHAIM